MARTSISAAEARRIALRAQGFTRPRPTGRVDRRHLRRLLDEIGLLQIDSVNVLVRSQELPLFARLGPHPRSLIPDATAAGELFEYWVHEASHVPVEQHCLFRWRMQNPRLWKSLQRLREQRPGFIEHVEQYLADHGPVVASDLASDLASRKRPAGGWWDWDDGKTALEVLFHTGVAAATRRDRDFARVYDLAERVLPAAALNAPTPAEADARKQLLVLAASYYGVATDKDLADYHRQKVTVCRPLLAELVADGRLLNVAVEGWDNTAYLHPDAVLPRNIDARALLSPFDPVVWYRDRAERLFDFHYRIEIYTPRHKRRYGYYVLPFLLGDRIVGRVDLKADRHASILRAQASWIEPAANPNTVVPALRAELELIAEWLELDSVVAEPIGNLRLT